MYEPVTHNFWHCNPSSELRVQQLQDNFLLVLHELGVEQLLAICHFWLDADLLGFEELQVYFFHVAKHNEPVQLVLFVAVYSELPEYLVHISQADSHVTGEGALYPKFWTMSDGS